MALRHGEELQQWEIAVAKKLVGEFRRRSRRLEREEFDDLLQECLTHWIEVRGKLAPNADGPPVAYMARVVRNKLTDMLREQGASKRGADFSTVSLDAAVSDSDDAPTFADLLDAAVSSVADMIRRRRSSRSTDWASSARARPRSELRRRSWNSSKRIAPTPVSS